MDGDDNGDEDDDDDDDDVWCSAGIDPRVDEIKSVITVVID